MRTPTVLFVAIAVAVGLTLAPAVAADEDGLTVEIEQDDAGEVVVTVEENGTAVENATVNVSVASDDENVTYEGAGEYETGENGTVDLPAPDEDVAVTVTATHESAEASTTATLSGVTDLGISVEQEPGLEATVTVTADGEPADNATVEVELADDENATYAGTGNYTTDENGTVEPPAPEETVEVTITATDDGVTTSTTVTLESTDGIDDAQPFGQQLQHFLLTIDDPEANKGLQLSRWVTTNNPGNAPDHAGPPTHAGNESEQGPPDHAGNETDGDQGPPENAGNGNGTEQGPPEDAGNGNSGPQGSPLDESDD